MCCSDQLNPPLKADIAQYSRHVSKVPFPDLYRRIKDTASRHHWRLKQSIARLSPLQPFDMSNLRIYRPAATRQCRLPKCPCKKNFIWN
jgi:hypothetical protein